MKDTSNKDSTPDTKSTNEEKELIRKYHLFMERESSLDILLNSSNLNQSLFRGFYRLAMSVMIMYIILVCYYNYNNYGYLIKPRMIYEPSSHLKLAFILWGFFHIWTYNGFVLQIMILKNYPSFICDIYRYLIQLGLFIVTTMFLYQSSMCLTNKIFILVQLFVHLMKIHSYIQTNRDYRANYLKCKETNEKPISNYPSNITFINFFYFLRAPTFVYEYSYPQNKEFRLGYFTLKVLLTIFFIFLMYFDYTEYIEVVLPEFLNKNLIELLYRLILPVTSMIIVGFFMLFECVLPAYAELSLFADRQFCDDWWNSTDFEEFNRKWNKIVHMFLYRHIYLEFIKQFKMSPFASKFITFSISMFFHEYCCIILFKVFKPYVTGFMLCQLPLITYFKKYTKNSVFGNYFFWMSVLFGNTMLFILYNQEYMRKYNRIY